MAKPALDDLYDLMNDGAAGIPTRLRAAVAASRVEPLAMPGESDPPGVRFLRSIVASEHAGLMFRPDYRREAATSLAYYERRSKKVELHYAVPDTAQRTASWRRLVNGALRAQLAARGRWPQDQHVLLAAADDLDVPACDPDVALSALLLGGQQPKRRRQRAIDERVPGTWSGSEEEMRALAAAVHRRLVQFD